MKALTIHSGDQTTALSKLAGAALLRAEDCCRTGLRERSARKNSKISKAAISPRR